MLAASLITLLSLTQAVLGDSAFFMDTNSILTVENLDPIVTPNGYAGHSHRILGGSAFAASYDRDVYEAAKCSSLGVQADKSNYWIPQLYWMDDIDGPYTQLPSFSRVYYFNRDSGGDKAIPFPKGMRILNGDPNNKSPSSEHSWTCHAATGDIMRSDFNFDNECVNGVATTVYFPSCWDGVNLWSGDGSHMSQLTGSFCPASHPIRVPQIQLEYQFPPSRYRPGVKMAGHLILSNGDTTGYGMHADFAEGWDQDVLAAAMAHPQCNTGDALTSTQCPPLAATIDNGKAASCRPERGIVQEPEGNADWTVFTKLPGCNAPWGLGPKPPCDATYKPLDVSALTGVDGPLLSAAYNQSLVPARTEAVGWRELACTRNNAGLSGGAAYNDGSLTRDTCQAQCLKQGFLYAATGLSGNYWTCTCGSSFNPNSAVANGQCDKPCPGNSTQLCGNTWLFQVYYAGNNTFFDPSTLAQEDGTIGLGCYAPTGESNLMLKGTYQYNSGGMTNDICIAACKGKNAAWAATQNGESCRCGPTIAYGSGALVPFEQCTTPCRGNTTQICGGDSQRATLFDITNTVIGSGNSTIRPAGYLGCHYSDSDTTTKMGYQFYSETLTPNICINGCNELGYKFAGMIEGKTCACSATNPNTQDLPDTSCVSPCSGNSKVMCGGNRAMSLFDTSSATISEASLQATRPAPYLGCFATNDNAPALLDYRYQTNAITVPTCIEACRQFGYSYAGLTNSNTCMCGKAAPTTKQVPTVDFCQFKCGGNAQSTCGGFGYLEAYSTGISNSTKPTTGSNSTVSGSLGCYQDRPFSDFDAGGSAVSVSNCRTNCGELGYKFAGLQNGNQCFCGKDFSASGRNQLPASSCISACSGNSAQTCGGPGNTEVFPTAGYWNAASMPQGYQGCYTDNGSARTLVGFKYYTDDMTSEVCAAACKAQGYTVAGTEFGKECYCSNQIASTGQRRPSLECNMACAGSAAENCGAGSRLSIYNVAVATNITAAPADPDDANSTATAIPGLVGCFSDYGATRPYSYSSDWMSPSICIKQCLARGIPYAGVQSGSGCICSTTRPAQLGSMSSCSTICSGDNTATCGGTNGRSVVYEVAKTGLSSSAWSLSPSATGFVGCFQDVNNARILGNTVFSSNAMTNDMCVSNCKSIGYKYAATQGGNQCFCGNAPDPKANGAYMVGATNCNSACTGDAQSMCGGSGKSSMFDTSAFRTTSNSTTAPAAAPTAEGSKGCFSTNTFYSAAPYTFGGGQMTTSLCRRTCHMQGFALAGMTDGNKCACGSNQSALGAAAVPALCDAKCSGDNSLICGGGFSRYVSLYDTTGAGAYPISTNKEYLGCWQDPNYTTDSVLNSFMFSDRQMTTAMCRSVCSSRGNKFYGTEDGERCYCGNTLPQAGLLADSQCSTACPGATSEKCGGGAKISVYSTNGAGTPAVVPSSSSSSASVSKSASSSSASVSRSASSSASVSRSASSSSGSVSRSASLSSASVSRSASSSSVSVSRSASSLSASVSGSVSSSASVSRSASSSSASVSRPASSSSASISRSASLSSGSVSRSASSSSASASRSASSSASASRSASSSGSSVSASASRSGSSSAPSSSASISRSVSASTSSSVSASRSASSSSAAASSSSSVSKSASSSSASVSAKASSSSSASSSRASSSSASAAPSSSSSSSLVPSSTKSALPAAMSAPSSDKSYLGCFTLPTRFSFGYPTNSTMMGDVKFTPEACRAWCEDKGFDYAGMNNGTNCGCTNGVGSMYAAARACTVPCEGDKTRMCGGAQAYGMNRVKIPTESAAAGQKRRHHRDFARSA